jgi:hypothetical protein
MFSAVELSFHFSKETSSEIDLKKEGNGEKCMLQQTVEEMYGVSTLFILIFACHGWIL